MSFTLFYSKGWLFKFFLLAFLLKAHQTLTRVNHQYFFVNVHSLSIFYCLEPDCLIEVSFKETFAGKVEERTEIQFEYFKFLGKAATKLINNRPINDKPFTYLWCVCRYDCMYAIYRMSKKRVANNRLVINIFHNFKMGVLFIGHHSLIDVDTALK